jgi:hypothetical protein
LWILVDPPWHIDAVGGRSHHQSHLNRESHALGRWLNALEARTHRNKAVVASANKLTRIVWAILTQPGTVYLRSKGAAA